MAAKVGGLARLMANLQGVNDKADGLADRLDGALGRVNGEMATTESIISHVESTADQLAAVNRLYSNGGPPLAGSSAPLATEPVASDPPVASPASPPSSASAGARVQL